MLQHDSCSAITESMISDKIGAFDIFMQRTPLAETIGGRTTKLITLASCGLLMRNLKKLIACVFTNVCITSPMAN